MVLSQYEIKARGDIVNTGANIKHYRREKGMSQKELADKMGYKAQSAVAAWENGYKMPRAARLIKLAEILGVTVDELLTERE